MSIVQKQTFLLRVCHLIVDICKQLMNLPNGKLVNSSKYVCTRKYLLCELVKFENRFIPKC